jgi:hypothetical protein
LASIAAAYHESLARDQPGPIRVLAEHRGPDRGLDLTRAEGRG